MKPDDQKMPSGMLERVARAINPYAFAVLDAGEGDITLPGNIAHARNQARAAIQAMREPDKAMIAGGNDVLSESVEMDGYESTGFYCAIAPSAARDVFQAMIDEALK